MPCGIDEFGGIGHDGGRLRDGASTEHLEVGCGRVGEGAFSLQSGPGVGRVTSPTCSALSSLAHAHRPLPQCRAAVIMTA